MLAVQAHRETWLEPVFRGLTFLGEELFLVATLPLAFLAFKTKDAVRFALSVLGAIWLVEVLKLQFQQPRPEHFFPGIALVDAPGYGFPSGHAALSVVYWSLLAWPRADKAWRAAAVALFVGIGLSRIYLGVHFPTQVLVGWSLGAACLAFALVGMPRAMDAVVRQRFATRIAMALAIPPLLVLLGASDITLSILAAVQGSATGLLIATRHPVAWANLKAGGVPHKTARAVAIFCITFGVYFGMKEITPSEDFAPYWRWLRYGVLGFDAIWLSPYLVARFSGRAEA